MVGENKQGYECTGGVRKPPAGVGTRVSRGMGHTYGIAKIFITVFIFILITCNSNYSLAKSLHLLDSKPFEKCELNEACALNAFKSLVLYKNKITKFNVKEVNIAVRGDKTGQLTAILREELDFISNITNISFKIKPEPAQIILVFSDDVEHDINVNHAAALKKEFMDQFRDGYANALKNNELVSKNCYGVWVTNPDMSMRNGLAFISKDIGKDNSIRALCLVPTLLTALGFADFPKTEVQGVDLFLMLRILYNYDIKPGMTEEELTKEFPTIYQHIMQEKLSYASRRSFRSYFETPNF
jgi:hypothetical protein